MLVRPPMRNLKMTVRADCAVSARSPLSLSIKFFIPCLLVCVCQGGELAFGQMSDLPRSCQHLK